MSTNECRKHYKLQQNSQTVLSHSVYIRVHYSTVRVTKHLSCLSSSYHGLSVPGQPFALVLCSPNLHARQSINQLSNDYRKIGKYKIIWEIRLNSKYLWEVNHFRAANCDSFMSQNVTKFFNLHLCLLKVLFRKRLAAKLAEKWPVFFIGVCLDFYRKLWYSGPWNKYKIVWV